MIEVHTYIFEISGQHIKKSLRKLGDCLEKARYPANNQRFVDITGDNPQTDGPRVYRYQTTRPFGESLLRKILAIDGVNKR